MKGKTRSSAGTQTITVTEEPKPQEEKGQESDGEEQGFKPNAYERGPR